MSLSNIQVPAIGELNLDHTAQFVPDLDSAGTALEKLGFTLSPFSRQFHRSGPGGGLTPAGTANRCIMLTRGYLEFLSPTGDTDVATQLRTSMKRYVGTHLIAFGTADPEADYARLTNAGFGPLDPVSLQREIDTANGHDTARFTVIRVPPGTMAEGRIQYCRHHTPELLWQDRWLSHANHAKALNGVILCVGDPHEAAQRYACYTGLLAQGSGNVWRVVTSRGYLLFLDPAAIQDRLNIAPVDPPWIAGPIVEIGDVSITRSCLERAGVTVRALDTGRMLIPLPASVGGIMIFEAQDSGVFGFA